MPVTIGLFLGPYELENLVSTGSLTSCEPKMRIDSIDSTFVDERMNSVGKIFAVADEDGNIKTSAKLKDAFVTTHGNPDLRMVAGLGFDSDIQKYKEQYELFWKQNFPESSLLDSTELFVCIWEHLSN